jgi:uncharacterized MAPEG superfamily protein
MTEIHYLLLSALLLWVMLLSASLIRARAWTPPGLRVAFGNRDDVPEPSPVAARADRAARNMLENLVLFVAVLAAAYFSGALSERTVLGAAIFFWARLAYFGIYLAGIKYLRTLTWAVALGGIGLIAWDVVTR